MLLVYVKVYLLCSNTYLDLITYFIEFVSVSSRLTQRLIFRCIYIEVPT